ncbi:hypothetical protein [Arthrobacter sp. ov407]|uniref:hypothetical protein n=1 Tax=Arthrobacter sp. ov407 TaxID=1761748 RepID=UPI001C4097BA|nr:hypothetical protein [Arthrobacter sp. ov407]
MSMVTGSLANRLDYRYHLMAKQTTPILGALVDPVRLETLVRQMSNGSNLPATYYCDDVEDAEALYVSVASLSQFLLDEERSQAIRIPGKKSGAGSKQLASLAAAANEVLITRSGTPGIAYPCSASEDGSLPVVPSGFLVRLSLQEGVDAHYMAAILNHPIWRITTTALSAGKRQDNISQPSLASVPMPRLGDDARAAIADGYRLAMDRLDALALERTVFAEKCDEILAKLIGLPRPDISSPPLAQTTVSLQSVAARRDVRIDHRLHNPALAKNMSTLALHSPGRLVSVMTEAPIRRGQPALPKDVEVDAETPVVIATSTIQDGQVVESLMKATTTETVDSSPLRVGDLLIAMDGDGSLGKASVFDLPDTPATTDSHVAVLRLTESETLPYAVACFLNSNWGRMQTNGLMTGATGQTQLSSGDLESVKLPERLVVDAKAVAEEYKETVLAYEPKVVKARRIICENAASVSRILIDAGALRVPKETEDWLCDASALFDFLAIVYPSVRNK